ncbi:hypothetical protein AMTRI_Chr11g96110 [Amborella trichopoda]|uniref:Germin-like protein n=1 Tax=Amborella trichopoda TaxID=13333 RepID=W1NTP7_AMBTC|nr:germin-like protein subfamily 3 member 2 [Amborella trichopoda]ERM98892.1 hypothetical protein AMTR_s00114p00037920 [Amborella trichopoda]|eukprot:XP_006836039.1 germin-like protein subfamily 3 member 2 [Amborella trichopoda]
MTKQLFLLLFLFHFLILNRAASADPDPLFDFCVAAPKSTHYPGHSPNFPNHPCKDPSNATVEDFIYTLQSLSPENISAAGFSALAVGPSLFPGLNTLGMSFVRAEFARGAVNVPHFHPRATELAYVLEGEIYSGFVDSNNRIFARILKNGEVMVFPKGLVHFQMNVGKGNAVIFGCFNSQNPGLEKLPFTIFGSGIDGELLEKAFGMSKGEVQKMSGRFGPKEIR